MSLDWQKSWPEICKAVKLGQMEKFIQLLDGEYEYPPPDPDEVDVEAEDYVPPDTGPADPDSKNERGSTALMLCATGGKTEMLQILIDRGASLDMRHPSNGQSAFHQACYWNKSACAEALIRAGCDTGAVEKFGRVGRQLAERRKFKDLVKLLDKLGVRRRAPPSFSVLLLAQGLPLNPPTHPDRWSRRRRRAPLSKARTSRSPPPPVFTSCFALPVPPSIFRSVLWLTRATGLPPPQKKADERKAEESGGGVIGSDAARLTLPKFTQEEQDLMARVPLSGSSPAASAAAAITDAPPFSRARISSHLHHRGGTAASACPVSACLLGRKSGSVVSSVCLRPLCPSGPVSESFSDYVHRMLHEPSTGLYFIHRHVRRTSVDMSNLKGEFITLVRPPPLSVLPARNVDSLCVLSAWGSDLVLKTC